MVLDLLENLLGLLLEGMLVTQLMSVQWWLLGVWTAEILVVMVVECQSHPFHLMPQTPYILKAFLLAVRVEKFHVSLNLFLISHSFPTHILHGLRVRSSMIHLHLLVILHSPPDIFRPFVGFREVRLVNKEPKHVSELFGFFQAFASCLISFILLTTLLLAAWWWPYCPLFCWFCWSYSSCYCHGCFARWNWWTWHIQILSKLCSVDTKSFVRFTS